MPTGYTSPIEEGCTFPEYLWGCARAFGALIEMREYLANTPIPAEFKVSTYHSDKIDDTQKALAELGRMTTADVIQRIREETDEAERANLEFRRKHEDVTAKYRAMRTQVDAWNPPTPEHEGLKRFMLEQIDLCTKDDYCYQRDLPIADPDEWVVRRRATLEDNLRYHAKCLKDDIARTNERNEWVSQLRMSIPMPVSDPVSTTVQLAGAMDSWRDRDPLI